MGEGRARIAASVLNANLANLAYEVRRVIRAGADRIHLDVMDAHFVPNLTFGAGTIRALRPVTKAPFDAHLMIAEPGRWLDEFLEAGCDSITIHVEIEEPIEPILRRIRAAGRAAGLALRPATPLSALEPYRELLDIVMVMTVEPGFGGQAFMRDVAEAKLLPARDLLSHKPWGGEVHVDGSVNRETAELIGGLGADVLVVGTALFAKGRDQAREVRLVRTLADEGYANERNGGVLPHPRDEMVRFAQLPRHLAAPLRDAIERRDVPVVMLRADGELNPDGVRDYDLLIPRSAEAWAAGQFAVARDEAMLEAKAWRARVRAAAGGPSPESRDLRHVRALLQRVSRAEVRVAGEPVGAIDRGLLVLLGVAPADDEATADALARRIVELRIHEDPAGRTNLALAEVGGDVLVVSQFTLYADTRRGRRPGFTMAAAPAHAEVLYRRFCQALEATGTRVARGRFGASMAVELVNDGPFTIWLDSDDR